MDKINKRLVFILVGIIAVILAIVCSGMDIGSYESYEFYGGDAYTGIQQAAAQTANNVQDLAAIVQFGFSSVLAVIGLICIAYALFCKPVDYTRSMDEANRNLVDLKAISERVALNTIPKESDDSSEKTQETVL